MRKTNVKGITLISLIITIIVLLILAGVSIATLTGDNGILTKAAKAREENEKSAKNEKYNLAKIEDLINELETGQIVEQVIDKNPGVLEGKGTESEPYTINSIEDLVFFAYDVTNGNNYLEKKVVLGLSLDFNSTKSYVDPFRRDYGIYGYDGDLKTLLTSGEGFLPIGYTNDSDTQNFYGNFDGMGNSIYNLYINKTINDDSHVKYGFFTNLNGEVCNVKLLDVNLYLNAKNTGYLGGICGQNSMKGNVNGCIVSGKIKNDSLNGATGGITYYSSGDITNCANFCEVSSKAGNRVGGICSAAGSSGIVSKSFNAGNITYSGSSEESYVGGIVGILPYGSTMNNCFNAGNIYSTSINNILSIGGCVGEARNNAIASNSYNIGGISGEATENTYIGSVIGKTNSSSILSNLYYKKTSQISGFGTQVDLENMAKTEDDMKNNIFIDELNENSEKIWKADINNINNGFPILNWQ